MRTLPHVLALAIVVSGVVLASSTAQAQYSLYRDDHVRNHPAHIGISGIGGAEVHTNSGGYADEFMRLGVDVIGTIVPGFALGFTRAGFGLVDSSDGLIFSPSITPTFEFSFFPGANVQLFLQLGATLGFTTGTPHVPFSTNAAITSAIGVRFWLGNTFTFGILIGNDVGVTNPGIRSWFAGPLGLGEFSFFGGLELGWNL